MTTPIISPKDHRNEFKNVNDVEPQSGPNRNTCSVGYVGFLGFSAQIPWTIILVHLPVLETVLGGSMFSYALGIAMGLACNVVRFCVVFYGRMFTFGVRVFTGCLFSAFFTVGYFIIYVLSDPLSAEELASVSAERTWGFWLGLLLALFGGAGNAQLMSTGYGVASLMSQDNPVANNLFFFGQAMASAICWPLKCVVEQLVDSQTVRLGVLMGLISMISISIIPIYQYRLAQYPRLSQFTIVSKSSTSLSCETALGIIRQTVSPMLVLWLTFFCTNMVTPGQLMQWRTPEGTEGTFFHEDAKLYRSLCSYVYLLGDAVGKTLVVFVACNKKRILGILKHSWTCRLMPVILGTRFSMMFLFYYPPDSLWGQISILVIFGLLNGIVASLALSLVSFRVDPVYSDVAGYLTSFVIINGLFSGSLAGMLVKVLRDQKTS